MFSFMLYSGTCSNDDIDYFIIIIMNIIIMYQTAFVPILHNHTLKLLYDTIRTAPNVSVLL